MGEQTNEKESADGTNFSNIVGVLDLETLDKFDSSIILSGGIVVADITKRIPFEKLIGPEHSYFFKLDVVDQYKRGRTVDDHIVNNFWKNREHVCPKAFDASFKTDPDNDINVNLLPDLLSSEISRLTGEQPTEWYDRQAFDFWKIAHLYEATLGLGEDDYPFPRNRWEMATALTHYGFDRYAGIGPWVYQTRGFVYHNPVHDSALDWLRLQRAMELIGLIEVTDV